MAWQLELLPMSIVLSAFFVNPTLSLKHPVIIDWVISVFHCVYTAIYNIKLAPGILCLTQLFQRNTRDDRYFSRSLRLGLSTLTSYFIKTKFSWNKISGLSLFFFIHTSWWSEAINNVSGGISMSWKRFSLIGGRWSSSKRFRVFQLFEC